MVTGLLTTGLIVAVLWGLRERVRRVFALRTAAEAVEALDRVQRESLEALRQAKALLEKYAEREKLLPLVLRQELRKASDARRA